ncbi:MAG: hypothetical protein IKS48_08600 [Eubacterium sp.]|nr:hypothetical protein [Eubacterium sp.]
MKKRSLVIVALAGVMMASCACGNAAETTTEATTQATTAATTEEKTTTATTTEATTEASKTASETEAKADDKKDDSNASKRSEAEGFIGKSCAELKDAIGDPIKIHPVAGADENGKYRGYLQYEDFDVEFESEDDSYLEEGDLSGCTVVAVEDTQFDNPTSDNVEGKDDTFKNEDPDFPGASNATKADVQAFVEGVVNDVKNSSWDSLGDKLRYPINIGSTEVADKDEFVTLMGNATVAQTFVDSITEGDASILGSNGQGIMVFDGLIWICDDNFDGIEATGDPDLKVKSLNGIVTE